jgi:hypothetical protein
MKRKEFERRQRLKIFRAMILPKLEKFYKITSHGAHNAPDTMYKMQISKDVIYDYYPMSEKIRVINIENGKQRYSWQEYKIDNLLEKVNKIPD